MEADGPKLSIGNGPRNFIWTYESGFVFSSDNKDMVLEAYEKEDLANSFTVRMAPRSDSIAQKWRIMDEYEDEDPSFSPAFALGSHKMDQSVPLWVRERTVKQYIYDFQGGDYVGGDLTLGSTAIVDIQWRRPEEITRIVSETNESPKFVTDSISGFDINQIGLGNFWAASVIANLANTTQRHSEILNRVFDATQSFEGSNHNFTFNFFKDGQWEEVTVDDYLPCRGDGRSLYFISSSDPLEFWPSLLEKAYAKFKGSYADIGGGRSDAGGA